MCLNHFSVLRIHGSIWPMQVSAAQPCPTLCHPTDCSPPGSSVHGILQARTLEWVAMPSSTGSSRPRAQTESLTSPALVGRFFTTTAIWEAQIKGRVSKRRSCAFMSQIFTERLHGWQWHNPYSRRAVQQPVLGKSNVLAKMRAKNRPFDLDKFRSTGPMRKKKKWIPFWI